MAQDVRFIIFNSDEAYAGELRAMLRSLHRARIIAEVDEPAILPQAVQQCRADVLLVNLDPSPDAVLPIAGEIAKSNSSLAVFAVSGSTDGQLILKAMRLGLREYLPKPIDTKALAEAVEGVVSQRGETAQQGTLITVQGTAGGVGATVLATNLAVELAQLAQGGVTVVDLDYHFGQVATFLDVEPTYTLADLCASPEQLELHVIERALVKHSSGVRVLSRPSQLTEAETMTASACVGLLSGLLQLSEYVVIDGPHRSDPGAKTLLDFSDVNLLIVQLLIPSVRNGQRILDGLRETGYNLGRMRLICNRVGRDAGQLSIRDVAQTLGIGEFASIPEDWSAVCAAINIGEPLLTHSPKSKARVAIREIAERLHNADDECDDDSSVAAKKGLIGRIFAGT
ncbi:MAG: CpaE family protein [Phycisphaerae bacterium]